jgi:hypothetical protein
MTQLKNNGSIKEGGAMFTDAQLSEMFRMGTLNGESIQRGKYHTTSNQHAQFKKCVVIVNREYYEITQTFPYKENKQNIKNGGHPPKITVYYKIKAL